MASQYRMDLLRDLSLMLSSADDYNVVIQAGGNHQNIKEFRVRSNILRARSPYFKSELSAKWITKNNNMIEFKKPNINPTVFEMVLKYIYTGEVDLSGKSGADILGLLVASDELLLEKLNNHVQTLLIEKQSTWVQQNFVSVLHTVFKLDSCKKLQEHCLKSICAEPQPFVTSKDLPSHILYDFLKRDDLQIEEAVAWDDINYKELKKILSQFIPRFVEISQVKIESRLIKPKLANKIANWIEREKGNTKKKYKFDLLYRSSRDGISSNAFRARCDNQGPCIVLVKQPSTTKIYGGYNPLTFTHSSDGQWYSTNESFIFSFENSDDVQNMKISRINNYYSNYAIHEQYDVGFNFGNTFYMNGQCVYLSYSLYYDRNVVNSNLSISFIPEEIEVLKVIVFP